MGFESKYSILNEEVIDIEKSKLNIADMWLVPFDHVIFALKKLFIHSMEVLS